MTPKRAKAFFIPGAAILALGVFAVIFYPAFERGRCGAWTLQVSNWQRAILTNVYERTQSEQGPPSSFVRVLAEVSRTKNHPIHGVEAYCWDESNESVRIGNVSLASILEGEATLEEVDAEVERLRLPVPRWEVFGGLAFLVYDPGKNVRADLPVAFAIAIEHEDEYANIQVAFEDGHIDFLNIRPASSPTGRESLDETLRQLAIHNLPPLPDSFMSRLPE